MKSVTIGLALLLAAAPMASAEFWLGDESRLRIGGSLVLQYSSYFGREDEVYVPDDGFLVRYGALLLQGNLGEFVEYDAELGVSRCPSSGSPDVRLLEGSLFYRATDEFKVGLTQGHVLRGFELHQECIDLLSPEKLKAASVIAQCHAAGLVMELDRDLGGHQGVLAQAAYLNGPVDASTEVEHDINLGLVYRTPLEGLGVSAFYNRIKTDFELDGRKDEGTRYGFGLDYEHRGLVFRGEAYFLDGGPNYYDDTPSEEVEMRAWFVQAGYAIPVPGRRLDSIQPYLRYQAFDRGSNLAGDHRHEHVNGGIRFHLAEDFSVRIDYETQVTAPPGVPDDPSQLMVRLQASF